MAKTLVALREFAAGAATACVALPFAVASGILVFSQFGDEYVAFGAAAGLTTTIVGGAVASLLYGSLLVKAIPIKSALIQSSVAGAIAASLGDVNLALIVFPFCIVLAGLMQIGIAVSGLSKIVNMTPYPVVAGFVSGVGALIIFGQIEPLFGVDAVGDIIQAQDLALTQFSFGIALVLAMFVLDRRSSKIPAPLLGLIVGFSTYHAIGFLFPAIDLGPVVGTVDVSHWGGLDVSGLIAQFAAEDTAETWLIILGGAAVIALSGTLDTAIAKEALRRMTNLPIDEKRDLMSQGVASVVTATTGGLYVTNALVLTPANYHAGGRTRWSPLLSAIILLVGVLLFPELVSSLPIVVLAAILVYVGIKLIDLWIFDVSRRALFSPDTPARAQIRYNALIAVTVMVVTVVWHPTLGAAVGAALACTIFIARMNRPALRKKIIARRVRSKRKRSTAIEELLADNSHRFALLELQGVLFFGNANDIRTEIDAFPNRIDTVVLDFQDVTDIDISGVMAMRDACSKLHKSGGRVLFSGLRNAYVEQVIGEIANDGDVFADLDAALEYVEDTILQDIRGEAGSGLEVKLSDSDLGEHLESNALSALTQKMSHIAFPAGSTLCRAGEPSDRLWVITRGSVSVFAPKGGRRKRLASIGAGCMVGEMGFLEKRRRSADVVADDEVQAYELTTDTFRTILLESPQLGQAIYEAIADELAERLRITSIELRLADQ